ncbi:COG1216 Predicted glycosyltransferases [Candidatus Nanopelagicaceae bacterium]
MKPTPVVSIITPVYNGAKYIEETIRSVLNAGIECDYEYLVLNDGSTDLSLEIISEFKDQIKIYSHENIGESETVNLGIKHAKGRYLLILSADDPLLSSELIHRALVKLELSNDLVAVYPDWKIINADGHDLETVILPDYSEEIMIGSNRCLPGPGVLFRSDAAKKIGGRRKKWKFVGDYDFWLRLSRVGSIQRLPGVLAQWRESSDSTSVSQRGQLMALERIRVIENFVSENKIDPNLQRNALANSYVLAARLVFFDPSITAKGYLLKAIKIKRFWPSELKFHLVLYIMLLPFSRYLNKIILRFLLRFK